MTGDVLRVPAVGDSIRAIGIVGDVVRMLHPLPRKGGRFGVPKQAQGQRQGRLRLVSCEKAIEG